MKPVCLDSSILVSIALLDSRGYQALAALGSRDGCTSELSLVECQAGISSNASGLAAGLPSIERALNAILGCMLMLPVTSAVVGQARTLVRRHRSGIGLRTLDAIHIASCAEIQAQLGAVEYLTADRRQHRAFSAEGFSGSLIP